MSRIKKTELFFLWSVGPGSVSRPRGKGSFCLHLSFSNLNTFKACGLFSIVVMGSDNPVITDGIMNRSSRSYFLKHLAIVWRFSALLAFGMASSHGLADTASTALVHTAGAYQTLSSFALESWIDSLTRTEGLPLETIRVAEPLPETLLPQDMASIAFVWEDPAESTAWMLTIRDGEETVVRAVLDTPWWIPGETLWQSLKKKTGTAGLDVVLTGIGGWNGREILSSGTTSFKFSRDKVNAWLMFMRKPLPFLNAKNNPGQTGLLVGDITSFSQPENIMSNFPVCANCHSYALNGSAMTLDTDYAGDKGGFTVMALKKKMEVRREDVFSWNTMAPLKPADYSMGLFARLSPDGRYLAGTVNETSVFVMLDDIRFSQLFFPSTGQIAIFDTLQNKKFPLPGASDPDRVQTSPGWSPDGKTLAFAAVQTNPELIQKVVDKKVLKEPSNQTITGLNQKYPVQFDIYTVPFNGGAGGRAIPLEGASLNGFSNYFPRYSPDGKWLVFTQSPTGLVLQPDSRLYIIPAKGGAATPLKSNQATMNSWHSWSPNSKWLVFTCKASSPYTELFLTHIDDQGHSSPAIRLFRFSHAQMAAMVPEFLPLTARIPKALALHSPEEAKGKSMAVDGR